MRIEATEDKSGRRLDVWLTEELPEMSRSRIQSLIKSGHITLEGRNLHPHSKVAKGMIVEVNIPPAAPVEARPENIPLSVLHEDADVIVVNKPAGLVVHPAAGHADGTLVNALLHHCGDLAGVGGEMRPGIVHRLDKDTSGVIVVAKNESAMQSLAEQFKRGVVKKEYVALVHGCPVPSSGRIETQIGRSQHDRKKMTACPAGGGRVSVTNYETVETLGQCSLLGIRIETGRTHQIRVHMSHIGHPILGDGQYGSQKKMAALDQSLEARISRQMLHAKALSFEHPGTGQIMDFLAPLPEDIEEVVCLLRSLSSS